MICVDTHDFIQKGVVDGYWMYGREEGLFEELLIVFLHY